MFTAVHAAFPRFVRSANALDAVRLLIELLADDAAVRDRGPHSPGPRAGRLRVRPHARRARSPQADPPPSCGCAASAASPNSVPLSIAAYVTAAAVLVVPTVALAVPWLTELQRLFTA